MLAHECDRFDKVTYNPWALELAMYSRGLDVAELAEMSGMSKNIVQSLIDGDVEISPSQAVVFGVNLNYPSKFFQQWFESRIEWGGKNKMAKNVPINYGRYKIMNSADKTPKSISFIPPHVKVQDGMLF